MLQFDLCCMAIDQNFDCGCDRCAILRLDSLVLSQVSPHLKVLKIYRPIIDVPKVLDI